MTALEAISPIDGRYSRQTKDLAKYFSEASLIKYRVKVEIEYFIALCELGLPQLSGFDKKKFDDLEIVITKNGKKIEYEVIDQTYFAYKVGDIVEVNTNTKTIEKVENRTNYLERPLIANIDKLLIICYNYSYVKKSF